MIGNSPTVQPATTFAALLKQLRAEARLTQEELAYAAGLSPRSISDLERGISRTARKDTALLLADALAIGKAARTTFVAAARGRAEASAVLAARDAMAADTRAAAEHSATQAVNTSDCRARFCGRSRVVHCGANGHSEIQSGCRL